MSDRGNRVNLDPLQSHARFSAGRISRGTKRALSRRSGKTGDEGFTLVELLIVMVVVPIIIGALSLGLITVFSLQAGVSNRLGDSSDAEVVAASYTKDVQGATSITTNATALCGSGTQLLGMEWGTGVITGSAISYVEQSQTTTGTTTYSLVRNYCQSGPSSTPTSSTYISYDVLAPCPATDSPSVCSSLTPREQPVPVAYDGSNVVTTSGGLESTVGMTLLQFPIEEPNSSYSYQLEATPAQGISATNAGTQQLNTTSFCGFALAGTGTFASTMCFVGFTTAELQQAYPNGPDGPSTCSQTDPGQQGIDMYADVPGGYVMSFCLTVQPGGGENQDATNPPPVVAVSTPIGGGTCKQEASGPCDWGHLSNGQGFLGN